MARRWRAAVPNFPHQQTNSVCWGPRVRGLSACDLLPAGKDSAAIAFGGRSALFAASRRHPGIGILMAGSAVFGGGLAVAAMIPNEWLFAGMLVVIGLAAQGFTTSTNSFVQFSTDPAVRGRVMAILLAIALEGTPIGAPLVDWGQTIAARAGRCAWAPQQV